MGEPDYWARGIAGVSLLFSFVALLLNWQKNTREIEALRPQVGLTSDRKGIRKWFITITVMNPRQVPMAWRMVRAVRPPGLGLLDKGREALNADRPEFSKWTYEDAYFVDDYPIMIAPGESATWECFAAIDDHFPVPEGAAPVVEPIIDGFDQSPSRFRRIAKWMWPSAIRM